MWNFSSARRVEQYIKGFQRFHTGKDVRPATPFSVFGRYTTKKKTQRKITQPGDIFSENPVKIYRFYWVCYNYRGVFKGIYADTLKVTSGALIEVTLLLRYNTTDREATRVLALFGHLSE